MRILIAGGTGVIGRRLVPLLVAAGHSVVGITRSHAKAEQLRAQGAGATVADVFDRAALSAAVRAHAPEAVLHQLTDLSAWDVAANARLREVGTRNLVDAALAAGVQRMVAQSLSWMYAPGTGPAREDEPLDLDAAPPRGTTVHGVAALEHAVLEMPVGVVLRYGAWYGPGTAYAPDGAFAARVLRGEVAAARGITSFLHTEDAARAALAALQWPAGAVNIVDDAPAPGTEWLPAYAEAIGAPPPPVGGPAGPTERGASNAKARRELGWAPLYPTWREGFARALT